MTASAYIRRQLVDLLEERRVVVWYDADGALQGYAAQFKAPSCVLVDTSCSVLQARREVDRLFCRLSDPANRESGNATLLIYCPRPRGQRDEDRY